MKKKDSKKKGEKDPAVLKVLSLYFNLVFSNRKKEIKHFNLETL